MASMLYDLCSTPLTEQQQQHTHKKTARFEEPGKENNTLNAIKCKENFSKENVKQCEWKKL